MNGLRKNTWLAVAALALGSVAFPVSYSEAQSADMRFSAQECEQLSRSDLRSMDTRQRRMGLQCDMVESSHDWEQQYGSLNSTELTEGVVLE
ncbi:hypothetical protein [Neisseria chenwenguii]|uniref:hypothetical protein n=1 Tax=Neisseria chenwenguii TaxID=1853278 RepID=UPI000F4DC5FE|nr:hypothetical protein [Neisseria chenwenguii]ROV56630.1 hypothetical protein EGS38_04480 [Neisseria chenwenguii]